LTFTSDEERDNHDSHAHFECHGCPDYFPSPVALEVHEAFGHGPFKCELCPEKFVRFSTRESHRREKHGGINSTFIFICRDCGQRYSSYEAIICHQVLYPKCGKFPGRQRIPSSGKDKNDQMKLLNIVDQAKFIYKPPNNETVIVV
jgi:hypothetical protein